MADELGGSPFNFIFSAKGGDGLHTYEELKRRRAIATALAARQRGYPKNVGEGLTYLGESIGEAIGDYRLREMERQQQGYDRSLGTGTAPVPQTDYNPYPGGQQAPPPAQPAPPPPPAAGPVAPPPPPPANWPTTGPGASLENPTGGAGGFPDVVAQAPPPQPEPTPAPAIAPPVAPPPTDAPVQNAALIDALRSRREGAGTQLASLPPAMEAAAGVPVPPMRPEPQPPVAGPPPAAAPEAPPRPPMPIPSVPRGADQLNPITRDYASAVTSAFPGSRITSGYRSPGVNAGVGGAHGSQHMHRAAIDMNVSALSPEQKGALIEHAIANGARGIGNYGGDSIHIDFREGPLAAWGPNRSRSSLGQTPEWFQRRAVALLNGGVDVGTQTAQAPSSRDAIAGTLMAQGPRPPQAEPEGDPTSDRSRIADVIGSMRSGQGPRYPSTAAFGGDPSIGTRPISTLTGATSIPDQSLPVPPPVQDPVPPMAQAGGGASDALPPWAKLLPGDPALRPPGPATPPPPIQQQTQIQKAPEQDPLQAPNKPYDYPDPGNRPRTPDRAQVTPYELEQRRISQDRRASDGAREAAAARAAMAQKDRESQDSRNWKLYESEDQEWRRKRGKFEEVQLTAPDKEVARIKDKYDALISRAQAANQPDIADKLRIERDTAYRDLMTKTETINGQAYQRRLDPVTRELGPMQLVPGSPTPPMTAEQGKSNLIAASIEPDLRAIKEQHQLGAPLATNFKDAVVEATAPAALANAAFTPEYRAAKNSYDNIMSRLLTHLSGAAVTPSEALRVVPSLRPAFGDTPQDLETKYGRLVTLQRAVIEASGPGGQERLKAHVAEYTRAAEEETARPTSMAAQAQLPAVTITSREHYDALVEAGHLLPGRNIILPPHGDKPGGPGVVPVRRAASR